MEIQILDWIQTLRTPFMDAVMPYITKLGDGGILVILVSLLLICIPKTRKVGVVLLTTLALEALCTNVIIKPLVNRTRPFVVNPAGWPGLVAMPKDASFPSGHTGASIAFATALCYEAKKRISIPVMVTAILVAFSRLYLYCHFPTDVLGGAVIGVASAVVIHILFEKWKNSEKPKSRAMYCKICNVKPEETVEAKEV